MKFAKTVLYVPDIEASVAFFERAFGFQRTVVQEQFGELSTGETTLSFLVLPYGRSRLEAGSIAASLDAVANVELDFYSEAVEQDFQRAIDAGATVVEAAQPRPWGQTVGYLRTPDGIVIGLSTPPAW